MIHIPGLVAYLGYGAEAGTEPAAQCALVHGPQPSFFWWVQDSTPAFPCQFHSLYPGNGCFLTVNSV